MTNLLPFPTWEALNGRGIRTLTDPETHLLESLNPGLPPTPADCTTCNGTGAFKWWDYYAPKPKREPVIVEYACECEDQWVTHRYMLYAGIGLRYQRLGYGDYGDDLKKTEQFNDVMMYLDNARHHLNAGTGMIFYGQPGSGKSMLSYLVTKHLLHMGYTAHFTTFSDMVSALMDSWRSEDARTWFQNQVRNVGFLVIDDIGKEHMQKRYRDDDEARGLVKNTTAVSDSAIEQIIRHRVQAALPTIITTNLDPVDIGLRYDSASILGLLRESSFEHHFVNPDFRHDAADRVKEEARLEITRPVVVA